MDEPNEQTPPTPTAWAANLQFLTNNAPLLVFTLVALAFVFILVLIFRPYFGPSPKSLDKTLLQLLAETGTARGLITFLVAVSTVAIAVILVVYLASSAADKEVVKERFAFSKEILTSLIGILGTIIGFYFGASKESTQGHVDKALGQGTSTVLALENVAISPPKLVNGGTMVLQATLSGGLAPYAYSISFKPDTIKEHIISSPDGKISEEIKLDTYDPAKPLDIKVLGVDAAGAIIGRPVHIEATP